MSNNIAKLPSVSIVIPTYNRESVLIDTLNYLLALPHLAAEILVVDQTHQHTESVTNTLNGLAHSKKIDWIKLPKPSITSAMNVGAMKALGDVVLFVDDDIEPSSNLVKRHAQEYLDSDIHGVAGQVIQSWEKALTAEANSYRNGRSDDPDAFLFNSAHRRSVKRFIGCNVSFRRTSLLVARGFDENFVKVAYRYEAEFAERFTTSGFRMVYSPSASLKHLKEESGGTRSYGDHRRTIQPSHSVGRYYYMLNVVGQKNRWWRLASSPFSSLATKYHLRNPWWIPITFFAELAGLFWAIRLTIKGPTLMPQLENTND